MSGFFFEPWPTPFPRWMGPFSPARGKYSGFRVRGGRLGAWVTSEQGMVFWPVVESRHTRALADLVQAYWGGGRVLLLPNGYIVKPLQKDEEVGIRVLIGRFDGSILLERYGLPDFDMSNPGDIEPGDFWPGPDKTGLECIIRSDGSLLCTWYHTSQRGRIIASDQLQPPDDALACGFRAARPADSGGRVRVTANGHVITNREQPDGSWASLYVGYVDARSWTFHDHWIGEPYELTGTGTPTEPPQPKPDPGRDEVIKVPKPSGGGDEAIEELVYCLGFDLYRTLQVFIEGHEQAASVATPESVTTIGERLRTCVNRQDRRFTFSVLASSQVNAYALPFGSIFVTEPLLRLCEQNEDMLAFVLAHEMGHIIHGHVWSRVFSTRLLAGLLNAEPASSAWHGLVSQIARHFLCSAYTQDQELEADKEAVRLTRAAGLNPAAGICLLQRLKPLDSDSKQSPLRGYFSSHPPVDIRINEIDQLLRPEEHRR